MLAVTQNTTGLSLLADTARPTLCAVHRRWASAFSVSHRSRGTVAVTAVTVAQSSQATPLCATPAIHVVTSSCLSHLQLGCLARKHNMVLVVGLPHKVPCSPSTQPGCPSDGHFQFNTQVAVSEQGTLLRYVWRPQCMAHVTPWPTHCFALLWCGARAVCTTRHTCFWARSSTLTPLLGPQSCATLTPHSVCGLASSFALM